MCEPARAEYAPPEAYGYVSGMGLRQAQSRGSIAVRIYRAMLRVVRATVRFAYLSLLFWPLAISYPIAKLFHAEERWWDYALVAVQMCGPTVVKFFQWAATRRDIFPADFCERCSRLHARTVPHSMKSTEATLAAAFGKDWKQYLTLDPTPVGSGCVAQVYRGKLTLDGKVHDVAVKVIHPHIKEGVRSDLDLMRTFAWFVELFPSLEFTSMQDSVEEFSKLMLLQLDLRIEARNMQRLYNNFKGFPGVEFPQIYERFMTADAIVETFMEGVSIKEYFHREEKKRKALAHHALDAFFKMLLKDNFVHTDLHPGNLFVREDHKGHPILVIFDTGIVTELGPQDRINFIELFTAVVHRDGRRAAELMMERARVNECTDPEGFKRDMSALISDVMSHGLNLSHVRVGELLSRVLTMSCQYRVKIESNFTAVILSLMVLEGVGRSLDPDLDLFKMALPILVSEWAKITVGGGNKRK